MTTEGPSTQLAEFIAGLDYDRLPQAVRDRAQRILIDTLASAIAGRHGNETALVEKFASRVAGPGASTIIGSAQQLTPAGAVLTNGYQVTAVTVCDVFQPANMHVTPQVVPPSLVMSEQLGASGKQLLTAVAAGLEVSARVGFAIGPKAFRERGWHAPGVIGPFGGAAAVGRLLNLDATKQRNAFGLAGSQSAGTFAQWGTPTIKFHQSRGSLSGFMAAVLADEGLLSSEEIFTNPDGGILVSYSDGGVPEAITDALGERWDLNEIALRMWPSASGAQTMMTSLFALVEQHGIAADDVDSVTIALAEKGYKMNGTMDWDTKFRAHLSARYLAGVALVDQRCWLEQFLPDRLQDPALNAFINDRITVVLGEDLQPGAARVEIRMNDGTVHVDERQVAKGDPADFPTMDEIAGKFRTAASGILTDEAASAALELLLDIDNLADVRQLTALIGGADRLAAR